MQKVFVLLSFIGTSAFALAQSSTLVSDTAIAMAAPGPTNQALVLQRQAEFEQAKQLARQAILNPVSPPDYTYLKFKDVKAMTPDELKAVAILSPLRIKDQLDKAKTPEHKERQRLARRAILQPLLVNQEEDATKTPERRKLEAEAAAAILNPRQPTVDERLSESINRPQ
jgi:hypothetical protein